MTTMLGVAAVVLLALAAVGVADAYREAWHKQGTPSRSRGLDAEEDPELDLAGRITRARYLDAWEAMGGRVRRLALLAVASDELSQRCRETALTGEELVQALGGDDYCYALPDELSDRAGRPGDPALWHALDRALNRLSAVADTSDSVAHADAHEALSIAARDLANELAVLDLGADLEHCWFCGRGQEDVPRLLFSVHAAICSDCVQACHERLLGL